MSTRTFEIHRDVDMTGLSGTGIVADGAVFPDGTTVVRWREVTGENYDRGVRSTTVVFPNVEAVEALHGHNGATRLVFDDPYTLSDADLAAEHDKARGYDRPRAERAAEARRDIESDPLFDTGHSKGPHLHFEAGRSLNGVSEDPA